MMTLLKVTVVMALALGACRMARRSRASVRHALLAAAFGALLVLPAASTMMPSVRVEVPTQHLPVVAAPVAAAVTAAGMPASWNVLAAADRAPAPSPRLSLSAAVKAVWIAGFAALLVPIVLGLWQMRAVCRGGRRWPEGAALVRQLAAETGVRRRVDVLQHERITGPVTCGFIRPAIVLPVDAAAWNDDDLQRAILHELEHVRRSDWAVQCGARLLAAVYWLHPLVWIAWRQLSLEAERACDDAVLRRAEAASYADQLVTLAQRVAGAADRPMLAMASRGDLGTRIRAVLDSAQARGRAGAACVGVLVAAAAVLVAAIAPLRAVAQDPPSPPPERLAFSVASVRVNTSGANEQFMRRQPNGMTAQNMPLRALITFAYQLQNFQLQGAPDWIANARFDIDARVDGELPITPPMAPNNPPAMMLRTLLADRFNLAVHEETREMPVFELVTARGDGRPGPALRASSVDCMAMMKAAMQRGATPPPPSGPDAPVNCGVRMAPGRILFGGSDMSVLANTLAPVVERIVVDRTGLQGQWDFEMTYTPDPGQLRLPPGASLPPIDPNGPSLFTALQEQLGLKLESARGPVKVLVIDRVEPLKEN